MKIVTRTRNYIHAHERIIMPAALLLGFIVDYITLNRVDQLFDNIILLFYVVLAGGMLTVLYGRSNTSKETTPTSRLTFIVTIAPLLFQYAIGGLFSGLFIFYFRSGTLSTSFPFLIVLLVLMLGTDYLYKRFPKASFQLVIFYIALLSYVNLVIPILTKHMGVFSFLGATLLASAVMYGFVMSLDRPHSIIRGENRKKIEQRLATTFFIFILLYFTNVIPPLPLSMKTGVVGYNVTRSTTGDYTVLVEQEPWYTPFNQYSNQIHSTGPVYAFSAIFAPTRLETKIYHEWSYYDDTKGWVLTSRIPIPIVGGRDQGFRGYSFKSNLTTGSWRVDVVTERGQVVGRLPFTVTKDTPVTTKQLSF